MFCQECGYEIPNDSEFCSNCGARVTIGNAKAPLPEPASTPVFVPVPTRTSADAQQDNPYFIFCKSCGKAVPKGNAFCIGCGAPMQPSGNAQSFASAGVPAKKKKSKLPLLISLGAVAVAAVTVFFSVKYLDEKKEKHLEYEYHELNNGYTIDGYSGEDKNIVIPDTIRHKPVYGISDDAFRNSDIKSVKFGKNVNEISESAFESCKNLTSVSFAEDLVTEEFSIGDNAFCDCVSLNDFDMPPRNTVIGKHSFEGCTALKSISFDNAAEIKDRAFRGSALKDVSISRNISIGTGAFSGCASLETVTLGNVSRIPDEAFAECGSLKSVNWSELGSGSAKIGDRAFSNCASLTEITADPNDKDKTFKCPHDIKGFNSDLKIGEDAFSGCNIFDDAVQRGVAITDCIGKTFNELCEMFDYTYDKGYVYGGNCYIFRKNGAVFAVPEYDILQKEYAATVVSWSAGSTPEKKTYFSNSLGAADGLYIGMPLEDVFEILGTTQIKEDMGSAYVEYDRSDYQYTLYIDNRSKPQPTITTALIRIFESTPAPTPTPQPASDIPTATFNTSTIKIDTSGDTMDVSFTTDIAFKSNKKYNLRIYFSDSANGNFELRYDEPFDVALKKLTLKLHTGDNYYYIQFTESGKTGERSNTIYQWYSNASVWDEDN